MSKPVHPLNTMTPYLPGLATHFANERGYAVGGCGTKRLITSDVERVSCRRCLRTRAFRDAWASHVARFNEKS